MTIGTGIAILGIWMSVGIASIASAECGMVVAVCALLATLCVTLSGAK